MGVDDDGSAEEHPSLSMSEADVLAAVLDLVRRGEYRDKIPGVPAVRLEGGGAFRADRRLYTRGGPPPLPSR
jgi:hypothetical protein